ncbi:MAG: lipopolysaccharide biosynthesis protein RfbH [Bacteroidales bacterium]|jgi:CDP-6-deoxy-D-xylo-4-hexulose-3-dehydrase|nr:lipopolysaccharide biosynthesis protein RfbH [Bacteroidales bacterium]
MIKDTKREILSLVKKYYEENHKPHRRESNPQSPTPRISYAGRMFDEKEMLNLTEASLEFWLTAGKWTDKFESGLADYLGVKRALFVNSGSSANLLAFMTLTSPLLKERTVRRGDEVITVACGFPTTVSPIIQYGAIPVFVDVTIPQYNIDVSQLENALSEKTKAVMIAHTLGNPFDIKTVKEFCDKHNLWLIEDNCDSLGSTYTLNGETKFTGTFGDIGTSSFYPPHHLTTGEGGAVYTNNPLLAKIAASLRDWGRDCICPSGCDNKCGHRFDRQYGQLPLGYDHKYVYSHFGYNLKATDLQAAIGCAQLEKLADFTEKRKANYRYLYDKLKPYSGKLLLPEAVENSSPSWFGFLICVADNAGFTRNDIVNYLEENNIQTRMLFAGNIIKHPCFDDMRGSLQYRVVWTLENTDKVMSNVFWIGVYPGMTTEMLDIMVEKIISFIK